jgi:hypothetical protein
MGLSGKERQRKWLAKQRDNGFAAVTLIVPLGVIADLKLLAEALRADRQLQVVPILRGARHFVSAKSALAGERRSPETAQNDG